MESKVIQALEQLAEQEIIFGAETEFVRFLLNLYPETPEAVQWAAAACLNAQQKGHVCLDISKLSGFVFGDPSSGMEISDQLKKEWLHQLEKCEWVSDGVEVSPLVLEDSRLYLHRFWKYEEELARWLTEKAHQTNTITADQERIIRKLAAPAADLFEVNWQQVALCLSFLKDMVVISGGPGTGKTYTVLNIIAAQAMAASDDKFRIALAAPTGKAARRLIESIEAGKAQLPEPVQEEIEIPETALTVHKLLGAGYRQNQFRYHTKNKLPYDLVVVDEASMLDITMWVRLVQALDEDTKLVVLGDKDQLASVESGSILGDICAGDNSFSVPVTQQIARITGMQIDSVDEHPVINDCVVFLTKSYRFGEESGIGKFANAVNRSDTEEALKLLKSDRYDDLNWQGLSNKNMKALIDTYAVQHFENYSGHAENEQLAQSNQRKILCALRRGPFGVEQINREAERKIRHRKGLLQSQEWYAGRIVMSTRNDSVLKVKNGELGICQGEETPRISFEGEKALKVAPARLMNYEPAYAITIHKSQGSEFNEIAIILPDKMNPVLSKEIIYTAVTRARKDTLILAEEEVLRKAIENSVERHSGLKKKLWNN
ncbi:exodeoxyribonuclease V subunit alpha [Gracilimonas mengyeensis]|uniref:DNA helicase/exodeoxyribonuclease V, alpha subunit n=1 Tax=Gracilimonas mengyeensis TaxID=1302730 RepID=A0A521AGM4_9BACT|nr:exodeoxyribonuclease V subunit alpha [Gracilimonas mengyeensis]SMO33850.1 DNA helicase/exodeoxyribonuclease V, alpha subunit [Gracilimonas mengyeensis]